MVGESHRVPRALPFRGLRYAAPASELQHLVCPPYDVIGADEQEELRAQSPYNAVHVELPLDTTGDPVSRYGLAAQDLAAWRRAGVLLVDARPGYYLAETHFAHPVSGQPLRRRDVLAALGLEPWS